MENTEKWNKCLAMIREKVNDEWVFNTWFAPVSFEHYDEEKNSVLLKVPGRYVYEFLDHYYTKVLSWALTTCFAPGHKSITLLYRIARQEPSFADVAAYLQQQAGNSKHNPCNIRIANARKRMEDGLRYFLGDKAQWLQGYDSVASWMTDNRGRGLLCVGTPGLGKTLLCTKILPVILGQSVPVVNAADLRGRLAELKKERILIIDDLGKEPRRYYGDIDNSFFELCDNAERTGHLLIITTNLSTSTMSPTHPRAVLFPDSIEHRYGVEVLDRLKVITTPIGFSGRSLRA